MLSQGQPLEPNSSVPELLRQILHQQTLHERTLQTIAARLDKLESRLKRPSPQDKPTRSPKRKRTCPQDPAITTPKNQTHSPQPNDEATTNRKRLQVDDSEVCLVVRPGLRAWKQEGHHLPVVDCRSSCAHQNLVLELHQTEVLFAALIQDDCLSELTQTDPHCGVLVFASKPFTPRSKKPKGDHLSPTQLEDFDFCGFYPIDDLQGSVVGPLYQPTRDERGDTVLSFRPSQGPNPVKNGHRTAACRLMIVCRRTAALTQPSTTNADVTLVSTSPSVNVPTMESPVLLQQPAPAPGDSFAAQQSTALLFPLSPTFPTQPPTPPEPPSSPQHHDESHSFDEYLIDLFPLT